MTNDKPNDDSGAPVCSKALLDSSVPASATNPSLCDRETLATFFDSEETKYEVKAEACREPPRDMVTQAMHAGFAAGMRFAAATVRCKPNPTADRRASQAEGEQMKSKKAKRPVVARKVEPVVRCSGCKFWDKDCCLSDEMDCGVCRRYPPQWGRSGVWHADLQCQTREDDWCGEYVDRMRQAVESYQ